MAQNDVRYLTPINIEIKKEKYCRFKRSGIKFIDYKDADFLLKLVNEQGKILPRRLTGTSAKYQTRVNKAIKRARHIAIMPYVADMLKQIVEQKNLFTMEVILKKNVDNLGYANELVNVKNGYGRNFLIPQGYAKIGRAHV